MLKDRMTSEASNEFETKYHDRFRKIREAAAAAIKELSIFRSKGSVTPEALDAEVARIAKEKLHPYGCDLVVCRMNDGVTRFLIKVRSTGRGYDLIKSFFHRDDGIDSTNGSTTSEYDTSTEAESSPRGTIPSVPEVSEVAGEDGGRCEPPITKDFGNKIIPNR